MDLSEPLPENEDVAASESYERDSPALVVELAQQRVDAILERVQALRALGAPTELVGELSAMELDAKRILRRLRVLSEQRLLALGAPSAQDPAELLRAAVLEVVSDCERRGIAVEIQAPDEAPLYSLDWNQTVEALRCILDNAVEAIGQGGRIKAELRVSGSGVEIAIGNDGPEIEPQTLARIRAGAVRVRDGRGLGLGIVQGFADALSGTVRFESTARWTEVVIRIPPSRAAQESTDREDSTSGVWMSPFSVASWDEPSS